MKLLTSIIATALSLSAFESVATAGCTTDLLDGVAAAYPGHNYMVFNVGQPYSADLQGTVGFYNTQCGGRSYNVWAFASGTFINFGDGGWINWAFQGNFVRSGYQGHIVVFSR